MSRLQSCSYVVIACKILQQKSLHRDFEVQKLVGIWDCSATCSLLSLGFLCFFLVKYAYVHVGSNDFVLTFTMNLTCLN
jgi:hypothetical protein